METLEWVQQAGFLGLLVLVLFGFWHATKWLGDKLFHAEKGLITQWVNDQRDFIRSVASSNKAHSEAAQRQAEASEKTLAAVEVVVSNVKDSHSILLEVLRILERVAANLNIDIGDEIEGIRQKLEE